MAPRRVQTPLRRDRGPCSAAGPQPKGIFRVRRAFRSTNTEHTETLGDPCVSSLRRHRKRVAQTRCGCESAAFDLLVTQTHT